MSSGNGRAVHFLGVDHLPELDDPAVLVQGPDRDRLGFHAVARSLEGAAVALADDHPVAVGFEGLVDGGGEIVPILGDLAEDALEDRVTTDDGAAIRARRRRRW